MTDRHGMAMVDVMFTSNAQPRIYENGNKRTSLLAGSRRCGCESEYARSTKVAGRWVCDRGQ